MSAVFYTRHEKSTICSKIGQLASPPARLPLAVDGTRYDAGDKLGFMKATVEYGLRHEELGSKFRAYLEMLKL